MMNKNIRFQIINYINQLTAIVFCYSIATTSLNIPGNLKKQHLLDHEKTLTDSKFNKTNYYNELSQESVITKVQSDLYFHKLLEYKEEKHVTQISINQEGKILGYKTTKLRVISYPIEKQIMNLLKKNKSMLKIDKSIYWLNLTNKY